jgi:dipeptidyl aminopeptidase/acylaminoacyl peptidase
MLASAFWLAALALVAGPLVQQPLPGGEFGPPTDVEFKARIDGSTEKYVELLPKDFNAKKPVGVVIALHGHGSDRWQYVKQDRGECKGSRDVAAKYGMIFISPDYRASTSWMGPKAEADVVQLIGLLKEKYKVRMVILTGGSMGGTSVLIFAALHPDLVDGVVSENGTANMIEYANFQTDISASYGGDKKQKPDEFKKRSPEFFPERFKMPLAATVSGKDTTVPPDSVRRLAAKLQQMGKKDLLLIDNKDGGHGTGYEDTVKLMEFVVKAAAQAKPAKDAKANKKTPVDKKATKTDDSSPPTEAPVTDRKAEPDSSTAPAEDQKGGP